MAFERSTGGSGTARRGTRAGVAAVAGIVLGLVTGSSALESALAEDGFPLRSTYPDVAWISTSELAAEIDEAFIVDARSEFEYDVIHIKGAVPNPVARTTFDKSLKSITHADPTARLIFYCNGHTCAKSYKAARRAKELGYERAVAYDAGIFEWARSHPDKAVLLGETPVDLAKLISTEKLRRHELKADRFVAEAQSDKSILIDARDPMQRKKTPDFGEKTPENYYIAKLARVLASDTFREGADGRTLYVFDAAGKQVRWLQYHLEAQGYRDYYFLEDGVWSVFGAEGAN